jgi:catechol 2,3-dioxygenase-like lactoylglutathione lyase family enzyme
MEWGFSISDLRAPAMSNVTGTRFVIAVHDLQKSAAFYRDVLGFSIHSIPDPRFLFYTSGACTIFAGLCPGSLAPAELGDHSYFAYLEMDDLNSFYDSVRSKGATICKTIRDEPWGMREFGVVTADGHRIMFASPIG